MEILTPAQTALYLEWFKKNKDRCRAVMKAQLEGRRVASACTGGSEGEGTLGEVLGQLEDMRLDGNEKKE